MYLEGERETWEREGATGAAWKCLAKWQGPALRPPPLLLATEPRALRGWGVGVLCSYCSPSTGLQPLRSPASCRQGLELEPSLLRDSILKVRPDQGRRRCARMPVGTHAPHLRDCSNSERGLLGTRLQARVSSIRVQVSCPSGPRATPWRLGGQSAAMSTLRMLPR